MLFSASESAIRWKKFSSVPFCSVFRIFRPFSTRLCCSYPVYLVHNPLISLIYWFLKISFISTNFSSLEFDDITIWIISEPFSFSSELCLRLLTRPRIDSSPSLSYRPLLISPYLISSFISLIFSFLPSLRSYTSPYKKILQPKPSSSISTVSSSILYDFAGI